MSHRTHIPQPEVFRVSDLELDPRRHRAYRGTRRIDLTTKEFALLQVLMRQAGEVLTRTQIISLVWDMNFDCDTNVVEVSISRLRAKVDDQSEVKLIHTIRGVGYIPQPEVFRVSDLELDPRRHRAYRGTRRIDLTTNDGRPGWYRWQRRHRR
ncbi:winged helix-turn-helix domain-containing protein [Mycobacterium tuberculosis]|uniref:winged helix-turn-helix domain-containing protein n=1 Tax=Mycobacterium tuberculosis TaxID=1773 RepID=UPI00272B99FA|nr:winged helix-turn-helix domain-containing protein [Mycobacterium tuberculosis]